MGAAQRQRSLEAQANVDHGLARVSDPALQDAVQDAEIQAASGELVEHDDVMAKLRRWADGDA